jgi:LmbE family N-acetylglucosaminyl deacetylase
VAVWGIYIGRTTHAGFSRRTKPVPPAPNEANFSAPNEAVGKMGKAPNEANAPYPAPNEAIGRMGKAPNEANGPRAERSQVVPEVGGLGPPGTLAIPPRRFASFFDRRGQAERIQPIRSADLTLRTNTFQESSLMSAFLRFTAMAAAGVLVFLALPGAAAEPDRPLRIIVFGAHPDDCELDAGGTAARWARLGHKVKFVSVTNGDIGHHQMAGAILARRRTAEVQRCAEILGITTEVLDNHDGELLPTLENRRTITRKIRDWKADIVISHRPNDYHPDHRYTGILVQDAAFMVIVPSFCPDVPSLRKNPVFLYSEDGFQKPNPFVPDVVVPIDPVLDLKVAAIDALESQFYEWNPWLSGELDKVPTGKAERLAWTRKRAERRYGAVADRFRKTLVEWLGEANGNAVKTAEAFEVCEYGSQPSPAELRRLFPFFDGK